jgi:hypothetical protein
MDSNNILPKEEIKYLTGSGEVVWENI